ncbi:MAG TPA: SGNH/GDSL hydrolase family protein [Jatrophihabitans sp.]|uniref:SGNH/GDSL hydrolase family protein n=1 Tax=Jatrophihabitans sp. TaxID=1932789 RepID=UPI002E027013|nr:SGNH/GDSL hydrolase family protein [Jatrophihabitans sp.]
MRPDDRLRRVALYVSGGLGAATIASTGALATVMWAETRLAKRRIPVATDPPPVSHDTTWAAAGVSRSRPPIRMAMLGDSTAAGYGVYRDRDTPAAQIAIAISEAARRPVHVTNVAVVGAESPDLPQQLTALGRARPELAIIMIGANDVTELTKPSVAVPYLADTVRGLCSLGAEVVVGTCPDLGTIRPLAQPLRAYARRLSRQMARAQTVAVVEAGGRTVSLGDILGPLFMSNLHFFAEDRFHPSAAGYAEAAQAVLPSCLDALGLRTRARSASTFTTRRVKPVARAAAQAAARPGTEVAAAERFGRSENRRGPLAQLRRRVPRRRGPASSPEAAVGV